MAKTIKHDEKGKALFGESDHLEISQNRSFPSLIFELLSEKAPTKEEEKIFELILNLSIDHGPDTPSAQATIEQAKQGKTISEAVASGILQINDVHGGAQEKLMELLYRLQGTGYRAQDLVKDYLKEGKRMPGYGHRIYKQSLPANAGKESDPRAQLIFEKLVELEFSDEFIKIARDIKQELFNQSGKNLTINIDGAIAVALCTFGWSPRLGKAVFIIARTPGLCGQYLSTINKN